MTCFDQNVILNSQGFLEKKSDRAKAQFEEKSAIKAHWSVSLSYP